MWRSTSDAKQSPWSSASEKGIDSLADWLIPTLSRPDDFFHTRGTTLTATLNNTICYGEDVFKFQSPIILLLLLLLLLLLILILLLLLSL